MLKMETRPGRRRRREVHKRPVQFGLWLDARGAQGVASWEARGAGMSNPSQVAGELARTRPLKTKRELSPGGYTGARYWDAAVAPADAEPLKPAGPKHPVEPEVVELPAPKRAQRGIPESMSIFDVPGVAA